MSPLIHAYDVTKENDFELPHDFNARRRLQHTDLALRATITSIIRMTEAEKLFQIRIDDPAERDRFVFRPGQFVMLEVPGYGEAPFGLSSSPSNRSYFELCVRRAGTVTAMLHRARPGAKVGVRGPFGTAFPMAEMKGHNVILIAGGLGLAPLRAPIYSVTENRQAYKNVHVIYGTKDPSQLLFDYQYEQWRRVDGLDLSIIVERPDASWKGEVGLITKLLDKISFDPDDTYAVVCGPPVMFKFVCTRLADRGMPMQRMFVSLERRMHCGMGKCYRCNVGHTSTCVDGPVFDYWSVMNLKEGI